MCICHPFPPLLLGLCRECLAFLIFERHYLGTLRFASNEGGLTSKLGRRLDEAGGRCSLAPCTSHLPCSALTSCLLSFGATMLQCARKTLFSRFSTPRCTVYTPTLVYSHGRVRPTPLLMSSIHKPILPPSHHPIIPHPATQLHTHNHNATSAYLTRDPQKWWSRHRRWLADALLAASKLRSGSSRVDGRECAGLLARSRMREMPSTTPSSLSSRHPAIHNSTPAMQNAKPHPHSQNATPQNAKMGPDIHTKYRITSTEYRSLPS